MNVVRGRVRDGRVETETELPEGAEVVVMTQATEDSFELNGALRAELELRLQEADAGDFESASTVLAHLRRSR